MEVTDDNINTVGEEKGHEEVKVKHPADNCDICISTSNDMKSVSGNIGEQASSIVQTESSIADDDKAESKDGQKKDAFELSESVNSGEDTEDESDDEEMKQFLHLMDKAERKNQKRVSAVQTFHFGTSRQESDWRNARMEDPESDTTDTEDEDSQAETRRFLSLMGKTGHHQQQQRGGGAKPMVTIKWQDGKVVGLPANIKVTRVQAGEEARRRHEEELRRRRKEHAQLIRREGPPTTTCSGKRKFEDRMTLSEAKAEDFTDTKDYVDFIQAKLKNVNIKIIK